MRGAGGLACARRGRYDFPRIRVVPHARTAFRLLRCPARRPWGGACVPAPGRAPRPQGPKARTRRTGPGPYSAPGPGRASVIARLARCSVSPVCRPGTFRAEITGHPWCRHRPEPAGRDRVISGALFLNLNTGRIRTARHDLARLEELLRTARASGEERDSGHLDQLEALLESAHTVSARDVPADVITLKHRGRRPLAGPDRGAFRAMPMPRSNASRYRRRWAPRCSAAAWARMRYRKRRTGSAACAGGNADPAGGGRRLPSAVRARTRRGRRRPVPLRVRRWPTVEIRIHSVSPRSWGERTSATSR
ncbi:MAG: hypothetical protein MZU91_01150 [Desulfosudis oleivorans]|nr:hypothetical protein [Desulfosudis oleivorans]